MKTTSLILAAVVLSAASVACGAQGAAIREKTLVAWVSLENTTQRGGSALTLIDAGEHFDAIVFGEKAPGKWMAGSDFFRRTQDDQSSYPAETADRNTPVAVAVVFERDSITVYRNGERYAHYPIAEPHSFDDDAFVLLGLRYVGHMGEIGFFAGEIEEARIYDVALDADAIAALGPNQPSDPKPLAQWTFEDGAATDAMHYFPESVLHGQARVAGGRLHLNGVDSYMEAFRPQPLGVQAMFYRPRSRHTGRMWDTWLYLHEGTYYLYYLANRRARWDNVSLATSSDGAHWQERGPILSKHDDAVWMGTGSTWKSPNHATDGKFFLNFSEWRGPRQTIFFAESSNLAQWKRLGDEYEFKQDTRWYEPNGRWDCIYTIPRPEGGLYGYWTATPKPETGGRFGFGQSLDGVTWEALPPPKAPGVGEGEVGAVEQIGQRYYMMFGTGGIMVTLVADKPEGPFVPAEKNFRLLSGHTYFSRFFPTADGVLVNHHSIARDGWVHFAPLKSTLLDGEGTLRLGWWKGNEQLKGDALDVRLDRQETSETGPTAMLAGALDVTRGVVLEGDLRLPPSKEGGPVGLYIECGPEAGAAVLIGPGGAAELGKIRADGSGFTVEKQVDREMSFGHPARFRLLLGRSLLEFYLDDVLIECYSLPAPATGRVGLFQGKGGDAIGDLSAWGLPTFKESTATTESPQSSLPIE